MNGETHPRHELAALVLGALEQSEAQKVQEHGAVCRECRQELRDLTSLRDVLSTVPAEGWPSPPRPSDVTLIRLLRKVRIERHRSRRRLVASAVVAGAAAAALVAVGVLLGLRDSGSATATHGVSTVGQPASWRLSGTDSTKSMKGEATVVARPWGSRLNLELHGVPTGQRCRLIVYDSSGEKWSGGSWTVTYATQFYWSGGVAIPGDQIARVTIATESGHRLLTLT